MKDKEKNASERIKTFNTYC